ncbi:5-(carboxyamino)imidazole ribonucleotide synthase [Alphaproteobacteria bacterium]|nr:5-(carboxyamino)imidazole ribonucleotide synthase [Alphaproteobacteria bacterium]
MTFKNKTIGILGGGQLGKMIAIAAKKLGYQTLLYCPKGDNPAEYSVSEYIDGNWDDNKKLEIFASKVDVITSEFENIPAKTLDYLSKMTKVYPSSFCFSIAQHRNKEKEMARKSGFLVPKWYRIKSLEDLIKCSKVLNHNCILKTNSLGYDGKGQIKISSETNFKKIWDQINFNDCILEEKISFDREVSILFAKSSNETECFFPLSENRHENGILQNTIAPAILENELEIKLKSNVKKFAKLLNLKGLLTIELFQTGNNFIFNEIAPRPHNSFHWTIEGCENSQFDILVKSITGQDIVNQIVSKNWKMINLLGNEVKNLKLFNFHKNQKTHIYGKKEVKNGRKMGHITYQI